MHILHFQGEGLKIKNKGNKALYKDAVRCCIHLCITSKKARTLIDKIRPIFTNLGYCVATVYSRMRLWCSSRLYPYVHSKILPCLTNLLNR